MRVADGRPFSMGLDMQIEEIKVSELVPYDRNPRKNDQSVDKVAESIREFGFRVPIVIDKDNVIVAGHTRLKAAKKIGMKTVPCVRADDLTEEQVRAYRLADNKVGEDSEWDFNELGEELGNIFDLDMGRFGFNLVSDDDSFGDTFTLPDGDKNEIVQMTFTLHERQKELIEDAMNRIEDTPETFGNTNKNGNRLYEVVRQWAEQRM